MDFQTLLIGLIIFIVSALLIYVITTVTMREKPYEEILAEQRQRQLDYLDKPKESKKVDKKKKIKKSKSNVVRENSVESEGTQEEGEIIQKEKVTKRVELELDPIPISNVGTLGGTEKKTKVIPKNPSKSIITNKDEKSPVKPTGEATEYVHRRTVPKDELELKHKNDAQIMNSNPVVAKPTDARKFEIVRTDRKEVEQAETQKSSKKEGGKKLNAPKDVSHDVEMSSEGFEKVSSVPKLMSAAPSSPPAEHTPKSNKKTKIFTATESAEASTFVGDDLLMQVQMAHINDTDIKRLVELLVGKLSSADAAKTIPNIDWTKKGQKGDPMSLLRKELDEKERSLTEEQQRSQAKMHEFGAERQRIGAIVKQTQEQLSIQIQENQSLKSRIQQLQSQHVADMNALRAQLDATKSDGHIQLQRLVEENKILQETASKVVRMDSMAEEMRQKTKVMDDALKQNVMMYNSTENAKKSLEQKVKVLEEQNRGMDANVREASMLAQKYNDVKEELRINETRLNKLSLDFERQLHCAEQESASKTEALKQLENKLQESEKLNISYESQLKEITGLLQQKSADLEELSAKVEKLSSASAQQIVAVQESLQQGENADIRFDKSQSLQDDTVKAELSQAQARIKELDEQNKSLQDRVNQIQSESADAAARHSSAAESSSDNAEELSRMILELNDKSSQLETINSELQNLRKENAVLSECKRECDEMKANLIVLSERLRENEARLLNENNSSENGTEKIAQLTLEENKVEDNEAVIARLLMKEVEWIQKEVRLTQLLEVEAKHNENSAIIDELRSKEAKWLAAEAELKERYDSERKCSELVKAELSVAEARISQLQESASNSAEKEQHLHELHLKMSQTESDLTELREKLSQQSDVDRQLGEALSKLTEAERQVQRLEEAESEWKGKLSRFDELCEKESALTRTEARVQETEVKLSEIESLLCEFREREKQWIETESKIHELNQKQAKFDEMEAKLRELEEKEATRTEGDNDKLAESERRLQELLGQEAVWNESQAKLHRLSESEREVEEYKEKLQLKEAERSDLEKKVASLEALTKEQNNLRDQAGITAQSETEHVRRELTNKEAEVEKLKEELQTLENEKSKLSTALEAALLVQKEQAQNDQNANDQELLDAKQSQSKLQLQVEHYKSVLSETEIILKKLQNNVEAEDLKWQQRLTSSESQLLQAREEISRLQEEVKSLDGSTELGDKTRTLEDRLEISEREKLDALLQLSQLRASFESLSSELNDLRRAVPVTDDSIVENGSAAQTSDFVSESSVNTQ